MPLRCRLANATDDIGPFIMTRTETKQNHLLVDLKQYILPCELSVGLTKSEAREPNSKMSANTRWAIQGKEHTALRERCYVMDRVTE